MGQNFDPRTLLPRSTVLQGRFVLSEMLGPPRSMEPWQPPSGSKRPPSPGSSAALVPSTAPVKEG